MTTWSQGIAFDSTVILRDKELNLQHGFRPNVMRCKKCNLRVTGAISEGICPNFCGQLTKVTWKEECLAAEQALEVNNG